MGGPGGLVGHLVAVVGPNRLGRRGPGRTRRPPGPGALVGCLGGGRRGQGGALPGLLDHRRGDHAAAGPHPPAGRREPVPSRVTTTRSGRDRARSMASDHPPRAQHEPASRVSRTASSREVAAAEMGADMAADRVGPGRTSARGRRSERRPATLSPAPVRASTAPVAPPWRSRESAALAGSRPETTTAATVAPAAASKASSQPGSTATTSSRVPTTPSIPASSSAPAAPRASSSARSRASARAVDRCSSCSAWRRASSATSSRRVARTWASSVSAATVCNRWRACSVSARRSPSSWSSPSRRAARRSVEARRADTWSSDRRSRSRACSSEPAARGPR